MAEKIYSSLILEMMGRPQEHLKKAAEELVDALGKEKGIRITSKVIHDLKKVENKDQTGKVIEMSPEMQLFSTFAEIEIEASDLNSFIAICFKYMPAHVEIIEPESFNINNFEISSILSEVISKLHHYDAIAKSALFQNQILAQKFTELKQNGNKDIEILEKKPVESSETKKPKKKK